MTADVDLTLLTGFGGEGVFVDRLLSVFRGRLPDTREFALAHRTLLLWATNGIPLDVSLAAMPFEEHTMERSSGWLAGDGLRLTTCSAEDLIVHKAFAGRDKDWLDVRGILVRRRETLRMEIVWEELLPLLDLTGGRDAEARLRALL